MLLSHPKSEQICENGKVHQTPPPYFSLLGWLDEKALDTVYPPSQSSSTYLTTLPSTLNSAHPISSSFYLIL